MSVYLYHKIDFFKGTKSVHVAMANDHSEFGRKNYNPWAIELLRNFIDSQSRAREAEFSIPSAIVTNTNLCAKVCALLFIHFYSFVVTSLFLSIGLY